MSDFFVDVLQQQVNASAAKAAEAIVGDYLGRCDGGVLAESAPLSMLGRKTVCTL